MENPDGTLSEHKERTGIWAWKHPHSDGTVTYTRLTGDVRFENVDLVMILVRQFFIILHCMQNLARR